MMNPFPPLAALTLLLAVSQASSQTLAGQDGAPRIAQISKSDCAAIAPYIPGGADYVPGVAVDGSAVAPADVDGSFTATPPALYQFDVIIDPVGPYAGSLGSESRLSLAHVTLDSRTGAIAIDGREIGGVNHALTEACARLHHIPPK